MARNTERKRPCNIPKSIIITLWVMFYECSITRLKKTTHILFMECIVRPTLDSVESNIPFTLVLNKYLLIECFYVWVQSIVNFLSSMFPGFPAEQAQCSMLLDLIACERQDWIKQERLLTFIAGK